MTRSTQALPPLTELLASLGQPAAVLGEEGGIQWANPAMRDLFSGGRLPRTLTEGGLPSILPSG